MDPKKLTHKALDHSDDVGAFIAAVVGLCGILNLPEQWNISANDLAMALGFGFTIIAFARGRLESAYKSFLQGGAFNGPPPAVESEPAAEPDEQAKEKPSASSTLPPPPTTGS